MIWLLVQVTNVYLPDTNARTVSLKQLSLYDLTNLLSVLVTDPDYFPTNTTQLYIYTIQYVFSALLLKRCTKYIPPKFLTF